METLFNASIIVNCILTFLVLWLLFYRFTHYEVEKVYKAINITGKTYQVVKTIPNELSSMQKEEEIRSLMVSMSKELEFEVRKHILYTREQFAWTPSYETLTARILVGEIKD